ncbi:MAG: hypothetical protein M0036_27165, partial [Desulfobacteraceae bacterium]|nr:hypothetical protein [Desulfobacteraceae bacterium]
SAWLWPKEEICKPQCAFWVILGSREALLKPETRFGLSLLAFCVHAKRGLGFPIVVLQTEGASLAAAELPTALQRALILPAGDAGTPAKLVAKAHAKAADLPSAYYLDMVGNPHFGQWFEIRPAAGTWPGVIFGVDEGEISFQAVGPSGELPKTSTLNYPMQGLKIEVDGKNFSAWAVRNEVGNGSSYYVKVSGAPANLLFGAFSEESEAEMYRVALK